jgi:hypothetical protein
MMVENANVPAAHVELGKFIELSTVVLTVKVEL